MYYVCLPPTLCNFNVEEIIWWDMEIQALGKKYSENSTPSNKIFLSALPSRKKEIRGENVAI